MPNDFKPIENYMVQRRAAEIAMREYRDYALSIGCIIHGDEIECTAEQSKLLASWLTKRLHENRP